jgi:hypothetical protein
MPIKLFLLFIFFEIFFSNFSLSLMDIQHRCKIILYWYLIKKTTIHSCHGNTPPFQNHQHQSRFKIIIQERDDMVNWWIFIGCLCKTVLHRPCIFIKSFFFCYGKKFRQQIFIGEFERHRFFNFSLCLSKKNNWLPIYNQLRYIILSLFE